MPCWFVVYVCVCESPGPHQKCTVIVVDGAITLCTRPLCAYLMRARAPPSAIDFRHCRTAIIMGTPTFNGGCRQVVQVGLDSLAEFPRTTGHRAHTCRRIRREPPAMSESPLNAPAVVSTDCVIATLATSALSRVRATRGPITHTCTPMHAIQCQRSGATHRNAATPRVAEPPSRSGATEAHSFRAGRECAAAL